MSVGEEQLQAVSELRAGWFPTADRSGSMMEGNASALVLSLLYVFSWGQEKTCILVTPWNINTAVKEVMFCFPCFILKSVPSSVIYASWVHLLTSGPCVSFPALPSIVLTCASLPSGDIESLSLLVHRLLSSVELHARPFKLSGHCPSFVLQLFSCLLLDACYYFLFSLSVLFVHGISLWLSSVTFHHKLLLCPSSVAASVCK